MTADRIRRPWMVLAAAFVLAAGILLVYWRVLLTNRVLASGDVFTYFTPYREFANAALRAGRLPLWNPYLFMGVPFQANPQAAVLYPLNWPFVWIDVAKSLAGSMALHLWVAGLGMLLYTRRSVGLAWLPATGAGLVFSLSGFLGARVGQINQLSAVAWLPWLFWLLDEGDVAARLRQPRALVALAALAVVVALQLLAGHTQTAFINMVGLGVAAIWPGLAALWPWILARLRRSKTPFETPALRLAGRRLGLMLVAAVLGMLLAAPQLLPTLELSQLSIRAGGLTFREAVSFSLRPTHFLLTVLPTFRENLADRFGTPAYAEFVAYVGVVALLLAAVAIMSARRARPQSWLASPIGLAVALAAVGIALSLGLYNPLTYVLYKLVPGFDLFRAPARWMILAVFGGSVLAGAGLQATPFRVSGLSALRPRLSALRGRTGLIVALVAIGALMASILGLQWPGPMTLAIWLATAVVAAALVFGRRGARRRRLLLLGLLVVELTLASLALEHTRPTAPEAITSLRTAPAHLLAAARQDQSEGRLPGRFLSLSGITYDPGDLAEIQQMLESQLPARASYDFVVASKLQEIVAPNLPLLWRLPAVDGYDGGVLPLRRYVDLQTLFLPTDKLSPDGRLREQLDTIPPGRLLRLLAVEHVITDKGFDVWQDGVYYDLQLSNRLKPGEELVIERADRLEATGIGVFSYLEGAGALPDGTPAAEVRIEASDGMSETLIVTAGVGTAEGRWTAEAGHAQPAVKLPWPREQSGWDYLDRHDLQAAATPKRLVVRNVAPEGNVVLRGVTLIDTRTGTHAALTLPAGADFRRVHSGDVKIYQSMDALPRAYVVGSARLAPNDASVLAALEDDTAEPAQSVVLLESEVLAAGLSGALQTLSPAASDSVVAVVREDPERLVLKVALPEPGILVLSDSWYPGWRAIVDGRESPVLHANYLFRAVVMPAGVHEVVFEYESDGLRTGIMLALGAGLAVVGLLVGALIAAWRVSSARHSKALGR